MEEIVTEEINESNNSEGLDNYKEEINKVRNNYLCDIETIATDRSLNKTEKYDLINKLQKDFYKSETKETIQISGEEIKNPFYKCITNEDYRDVMERVRKEIIDKFNEEKENIIPQNKIINNVQFEYSEIISNIKENDALSNINKLNSLLTKLDNIDDKTIKELKDNISKKVDSLSKELQVVNEINDMYNNTYFYSLYYDEGENACKEKIKEFYSLVDRYVELGISKPQDHLLDIYSRMKYNFKELQDEGENNTLFEYFKSQKSIFLSKLYNSYESQIDTYLSKKPEYKLYSPEELKNVSELCGNAEKDIMKCYKYYIDLKNFSMKYAKVCCVVNGEIDSVTEEDFNEKYKILTDAIEKIHEDVLKNYSEIAKDREIGLDKRIIKNLETEFKKRYKIKDKEVIDNITSLIDVRLRTMETALTFGMPTTGSYKDNLDLNYINSQIYKHRNNKYEYHMENGILMPYKRVTDNIQVEYESGKIKYYKMRSSLESDKKYINTTGIKSLLSFGNEDNEVLKGEVLYSLDEISREEQENMSFGGEANFRTNKDLVNVKLKGKIYDLLSKRNIDFVKEDKSNKYDADILSGNASLDVKVVDDKKIGFGLGGSVIKAGVTYGNKDVPSFYASVDEKYSDVHISGNGEELKIAEFKNTAIGVSLNEKGVDYGINDSSIELFDGAISSGIDKNFNKAIELMEDGDTDILSYYSIVKYFHGTYTKFCDGINKLLTILRPNK